MIENECFPIEGIKVDGITVERCDPDISDDLAWQTFTLLTKGLGLENPGEDEEITRYFRMLMSKGRVFRPGTVYANPCGVVRSPTADRLFIQSARQIQREWYGRFNNALASAQRVKRAMRAVNPIIRQLTYTGVLFIDNQHVFPDRWPDIIPASSKKPRVRPRQRFENLVVLEALPCGQVHCRCECGTESVKKRIHLVSGQIRSCGCSQAERQERQRNRRRDRGWRHTGNLGS
jgi:hypothetical protein